MIIDNHTLHACIYNEWLNWFLSFGSFCGCVEGGGEAGDEWERGEGSGETGKCSEDSSNAGKTT